MSRRRDCLRCFAHGLTVAPFAFLLGWAFGKAARVDPAPCGHFLEPGLGPFRYDCTLLDGHAPPHISERGHRWR